MIKKTKQFYLGGIILLIFLTLWGIYLYKEQSFSKLSGRVLFCLSCNTDFKNFKFINLKTGQQNFTERPEWFRASVKVSYGSVSGSMSTGSYKPQKFTTKEVGWSNRETVYVYTSPNGRYKAWVKYPSSGGLFLDPFSGFYWQKLYIKSKYSLFPRVVYRLFQFKGDIEGDSLIFSPDSKWLVFTVLKPTPQGTHTGHIKVIRLVPFSRVQSLFDNALLTDWQE